MRTLFLCIAILTSVVEVGQEPGKLDDAKKALADALVAAEADRKHVLLNFGADWCLECRIVDNVFAEPPVAAFLKTNFVVVPIAVAAWLVKTTLS